MGKASRQKRERAISEEQRQSLVNKGVKTIQNASTSEQIEFLDAAVKSRRITHSRIFDMISTNAPTEMRKGIAKFVRDGKPLTVENLLAEYRQDKSFQTLARNAGCDEQWFIDLANRELEAYNKEHKEHGEEICQQSSTKQEAQETVVHKLRRKLRLV